jgi:hypothetical protein
VLDAVAECTRLTVIETAPVFETAPLGTSGPMLAAGSLSISWTAPLARLRAAVHLVLA